MLANRPYITYTNEQGLTLDFNNFNLETGEGLFVKRVNGDGVPEGQDFVVPIPQEDGEVYISTRYGARFLEVELLLQGNTESTFQSLRRNLSRFMTARTIPGTIYYTPVGVGTEYMIQAIPRGISFDQEVSRNSLECIATFRCPKPAFRVNPINNIPLDLGGTGLTIPMTIPLTITPPGDERTIVNAGHRPVFPRLTATGDFTGIAFENVTTGKIVQFSGLIVAPGDTLILDFMARTDRLNDTNIKALRDPGSVTWPLEIGDNIINVTVQSGTISAFIEYYTEYMGV